MADGNRHPRYPRWYPTTHPVKSDRRGRRPRRPKLYRDVHGNWNCRGQPRCPKWTREVHGGNGDVEAPSPTVRDAHGGWGCRGNRLIGMDLSPPPGSPVGRGVRRPSALRFGSVQFPSIPFSSVLFCWESRWNPNGFPPDSSGCISERI